MASLLHTMYNMIQLLVIAAGILVPVNSIAQKSLPLIIPSVEIPTNPDINQLCPANLDRESAHEEVLNSVQSLLQSLFVEECGDGVWSPVGFLNMSDPTTNCPSAWREYSQRRSCGRKVSGSASCPSNTYSVGNTQYSKVCGRVIGYQYGSPAAFENLRGQDLDGDYVDGVSITHGNPRTHIWTLAVGSSDGNHIYSCPCLASSAAQSPSYVGDSYFCDNGFHGTGYRSGFFADDPLWDGQGCQSGNCCIFNSPPWFSVELNEPTTNDIEVRICADQDTNDEDITVELIELYIQ